MSKKKWESYEEVAAYLLNQFAEKFELGKFEGKQIVPGVSGTDWQIDAKGYSDDGQQFVVVECKRYTSSRINQAITSSLAWIIQDTGASGGILVSERGLQAGAKLVAAKAGIHEVILDKNSTTTDYVLKFLNQVCIGVSVTEKVTITDSCSAVLKDADGNIIETRNA